MELANQKLASEIEREKDRIQRLQENPAEQEHEIRQRLKLAKPGEKIYILDDKKTIDSPRNPLPAVFGTRKCT